MAKRQLSGNRVVITDSNRIGIGCAGDCCGDGGGGDPTDCPLCAMQPDKVQCAIHVYSAGSAGPANFNLPFPADDPLQGTVQRWLSSDPYNLFQTVRSTLTRNPIEWSGTFTPMRRQRNPAAGGPTSVEGWLMPLDTECIDGTGDPPHGSSELNLFSFEQEWSPVPNSCGRHDCLPFIHTITGDHAVINPIMFLIWVPGIGGFVDLGSSFFPSTAQTDYPMTHISWSYSSFSHGFDTPSIKKYRGSLADFNYTTGYYLGNSNLRLDGGGLGWVTLGYSNDNAIIGNRLPTEVPYFQQFGGVNPQLPNGTMSTLYHDEISVTVTHSCGPADAYDSAVNYYAVRHYGWTVPLAPFIETGSIGLSGGAYLGEIPHQGLASNTFEPSSQWMGSASVFNTSYVPDLPTPGEFSISMSGGF